MNPLHHTSSLKTSSTAGLEALRRPNFSYFNVIMYTLVFSPCDNTQEGIKYIYAQLYTFQIYTYAYI